MLGVLLVIALNGAAPARAADFTWNGSAPSGSPEWSNSSNWVGGTAPTGSIGTLTFPALTSSACTAPPSAPPTNTCRVSQNDLLGASVQGLSIAGSDATPDDYGIYGNQILLGAGGLSATTPRGRFAANVSLPIALTTPQTWTLSQASAGDAHLSPALQVSGGVTGTSEALDIHLNDGAFLNLGQDRQQISPPASTVDNEVGALTATGSGDLAFLGSLNGTDANPIHLVGVFLAGDGTAGPITSTGGGIAVGKSLPEESGTGILAVNGNITLDSASDASFAFTQAGTTPGQDYGQLSAAGDINLGGARLSLLLDGHCPSLKVDDTATIVSAGGALSGTFGGLPDGSLVTTPISQANCDKTVTLRINYSAHAVTASVVQVNDDTGPCTEITDSGQGPIGLALHDLDNKSRGFTTHLYSKPPVFFDFYGSVGPSDSRLCVKNLSILGLSPFDTNHFYSVLEASALGQHLSFWLDPLTGWLFNPSKPDWQFTPGNQTFSIDWTTAKVLPSPLKIDLSLIDNQATIDVAPIANAVGPTLATRLVEAKDSQGRTVSLDARSKVHLETGARAGFGLTKKVCYIETSSLPIGGLGFAINNLDILVQQATAVAFTELGQAEDEVLRHVPGLAVNPATVIASIQPLVNAFSAACYEGALAAVEGQALAVVVVGVVIVAAPAAGAVLVSATGAVIIFSAARAGAAARASVSKTTAARATVGGPPATALPAAVKRLAVRTVRIHAHSVRRAFLPKGRALLAAVQLAQTFRVRTRVAHLLLSRPPKPGRRITVVGARLTRHKPHRALVMLTGPGFLATGLVRERFGVAGGNIKLPTHLRHGTWTLAVIDNCGLHPKPHHRLGGTSDIRLTTFKVE